MNYLAFPERGSVFDEAFLNSFIYENPHHLERELADMMNCDQSNMMRHLCAKKNSTNFKKKLFILKSTGGQPESQIFILS